MPKLNGVSTKKIFLALVVLGIFYAGIAMVLAVQGASSLDEGSTSRYTASESSSESAYAEAGNVTELNISGRSVTTHWAGFYGDISGNVTLGDANQNVFYDWTGIGTPTGEVLASNDTAVDWSTIDCASEAEIAELDLALGIIGADPDGVEETYVDTTHPAFSVGGQAISGCNHTNAYSNSAKASNLYHQILLMDGGSDPVYTTLINDSGTGFDNTAYDFQLLVGEADSAGSSQLYFYIELD